MGKIAVNSKIIANWWDYYLVSWGIKKNAALFLKTKTDTMKIVLDQDILHYRKGLIKAIFRLVKEDRLRYSRKQDEMVIYTIAKDKNKRLKSDFMAIETVEKLLNLNLNFEPFDSTLFIVDIADGVKILIRKNIVNDITVATETFIHDEYATLKPYFKNAVVLDVGAYIGDSSIKFILAGAKQVYAYEPHHELYNLALKNIELNNLGVKIMLNNLGVSNKQANIKIKEDSYLGASGVFGSSNYQKCKDVEVSLLSLGSIIREKGDIDVMKMDCEGAEFKAILSCPVEILRKIRVMLIEYHDDPEPLISYLKKAGFETTIEKQTFMLNRKIGLLFAKLKMAKK